MTNEIHNLLISKIPTKFHCGISQTEHHAGFVYYGLVIMFLVLLLPESNKYQADSKQLEHTKQHLAKKVSSFSPL